MSDHSHTNKLRDFWIIFFIALLILNFMVYYFRPITDSDIWFHLLFGKIYIETMSMTIDHSIFSWTPTTKEPIYHTWLGSILYYIGYKLAGINSIFFIRFTVLALYNLLTIYFVFKLNLIRNYLAWFLLISSQVFLIHVAQDKPTMFSFLYMCIISFLYFTLAFKKSFDYRLFYLFPIIMLLWVNTHGGFIFGIGFISMMLLGEILNFLILKRSTFEKKIIHHFYISIILSYLACLITPYGYKYILFLFNSLILGKQDPILFLSINEYTPTLQTKPLLDHLIYYTIFSFIFLLFISEIYLRRFNFSFLLINILFIYLFFKFLRTTYFLPPVLLFSSLLMLKDSILSNILHKKIIHSLCFIFLFIFCLHNTIFYFYRSFCVLGFSRLSLGKGIGYFEKEADVYLKYLRSYRLCNDYISGGYLLWRGWPDVKVMIDARQFPYRDWYREYLIDFYGAVRLKDFLNKYQCEVVYVSYGAEVIPHLIKDTNWNLVYIGQRGVIFKKNTINLPLSAYGVQDTDFDFPYISSADRFINILMDINDFETLDKLFSFLESKIICDRQRQELNSRKHLYLALRSYLSRDFTSLERYLEGIELKFLGNTILYSDLSLRLAQHYFEKLDLNNAYKFTLNAYRITKNNDTLYSLGVIKWLAEKKKIELINDPFSGVSWQDLIKKFLQGKLYETDHKTITSYEILSEKTPENIKLY